MFSAVSVVASEEPHFYLAAVCLSGFSAIKFSPAGFPSHPSSSGRIFVPD